MTFIPAILLSAALLGLLRMRRASRKAAQDRENDGGRKEAPDFSERHEARRRIVREAARLRELEDAVMRFSEGSEPAVLPEESEGVRLEAARLRSKLESECVRRGLPIGLVRRSRAVSVMQMGRTPGRD